jgi:peptidoglycan/xylan/chitin deacetylase (PgdA/CDA1 family)
VRIPVRPSFLMRLLYPRAIWRVNPAINQVYLTFDDGPVPEVTPEVLKILKETGVKATFFCIGDNVRKYPDLYKRIIDEGHLTANHTFHHLNGFKTPTAKYMNDIAQCEALVKGRFFRPPYGRMKPLQYISVNSRFKVIMWDVLSGDYDADINSEQCRANVLKYCRSGSVIVFHDSLKAAANMLPILSEVITTLKQTYAFARIDNMEDIKHGNA